MSVPEIDVTELARLRERDIELIDVREPHEFEKARVPGARLIPLADVAERIDDVRADATVYVICATGVRSARAAGHYRANGIDAINVAGGTRAWIEAGHPFDTGAAT
jgi:rhodanese-related sulfurtransferase